MLGSTTRQVTAFGAAFGQEQRPARGGKSGLLVSRCFPVWKHSALPLSAGVLDTLASPKQ